MKFCMVLFIYDYDIIHTSSLQAQLILDTENYEITIDQAWIKGGVSLRTPTHTRPAPSLQFPELVKL